MVQGESSDIFEVIYNCRAMRRIKRDPVPEELLVKLVDAANQGPTASNSQPGRWIIVRDAAVKQKLADLNRAAIDRSYPPEPPDAPPSAFRWQYDHMQDIPALIIACLSLRDRSVDSFADGIAVGGSIWPAIQNLLLAARALGLGACPTTLPLHDREEARRVLAMPDHVQPVCLIPVGYPMGRFGPVTRRPLDHILHFDQWETRG